VLSNTPPVWSSNDRVAGNTASTGWLGTAEAFGGNAGPTSAIRPAHGRFSVQGPDVTD
jgi:hypothetical protein